MGSGGMGSGGMHIVLWKKPIRPNQSVLLFGREGKKKENEREREM